MEHTVSVNRPAEEVFAYLADVRNLPQWQQGVVETRPQGDPGVGSRFIEVRSFLGKRMESTIEIVEYEPSRLFTIKVIEGPIPFEVRHTLEPDGEGTRVRVVGEGEPGGFFKLAEGLVTRQVQKAAEKDFAKLKQVLEATS
jgi:carbon monoxide dehydrogenase subunit G